VDNPSYPPSEPTVMSAPPPSMPAPGSTADKRNWMAITSLVLGIVNFCAMFIPCCGQILPIAGLILGILGLQSNRRNLAIAGIVLAVITLCLSFATSGFEWQRYRNNLGY
jgi:hypothetical protein